MGAKGASVISEKNFETAIEAALLGNGGGYEAGDANRFDATRGIFPDDVFDYLQHSQPKQWAALDKALGPKLKQQLLHDLVGDLDHKGTLEVLRRGFKCQGTKLSLATFKPAHGLNPAIEEQYAKNNLTITRQVFFDPNSKQSVDVVLALNGLPVATLELKNSLTGQTAADAEKQYRKRDPNLPLFRWTKRALVHFCVDTDTVSMTTKLAGEATRFLPFNRGSNGGAGNPVPDDGSYKTAYLWGNVLAFDSFLDILGRYMAVITEKEIVPTTDGPPKIVESKSLLFPRFHQLDAVRRLERQSTVDGAGKHYLVQHSAGSGKSNTIAWLAYRLSSLHDDKDQKVFDSVIVVTDRTILDSQLQDTIYQFDHTPGVVAKIDENSEQLANALKSGKQIVITTLQKFPFVTSKLAELPDRRYAVIVDEAHSSQTGEAARSLREALATKEDKAKAAKPAGQTDPDAEEDDDDELSIEDEILKRIQSRGAQKNVSFFAFTATPKAKTLEVFGTKGVDGKPSAFHLYTMRQAIEERFILDVVKNFTTYSTYYQLVSESEKDRTVKKREATKALAAYMSLHPHNIEQKVRVIVDHFRWTVRPLLGGKAKAMVVTRSRLHAVKYKQAVDAYLKAEKISDIKALVAFSGTVVDDVGASYTEPGMNVDAKGKNIPEKELRLRFASDEFQLLLVANKYQTGFDQPLLCAMYVDRKLSGVQAVQTLSRLNRIYPGKDVVFVLDFANKAHEIRDAFQPYYNATIVDEQANPQHLKDLGHDLDNGQVWSDALLKQFAAVYYKQKSKLAVDDHQKIHAALDPAVEAFKALDEEKRDAWKGKLGAFTRLYAFLAQVMTYGDPDLEVRFSYGRLLLKRLPRTKSDPLHLDGDVSLAAYRLSDLGATKIALDAGAVGKVKGPSETGTGGEKDVDVALSSVIDLFNKKFGTDFNEGDKLGLDQIVADSKDDESVQQKAKANDFPEFLLGVKEKLVTLVVQRRDRNEKMVEKVLDDADFQKAVVAYLAQQIYDEARKKAG